MGRLQEGKTPGIGQVRHWHKAIAREAVKGTRPSDLALLFGMSCSQISSILGSPLFMAEMERLESQAEYEAVDVRSELEIRQGRALETIDMALNCGDVKIAVATGFEVLDRTGYAKGAPMQKHLHLHAHGALDDLSDEDLAREAIDLLEE